MKTNIHKNSIVLPDLSYIIQGCMFETRNQYGPGHKEHIYQKVMEEKLQKEHIVVEREKRITIYSQDSGRLIGTYQPDLVVEDKVIIEIKSTRVSIELDEKQLYHYLRNSKYELGYLVNFSTPKLYIKHIVYSNDRKPYLLPRER